MNIGITGSIACGKSTVSDYLKEKGYTIIDADKLGHVALTSEDVKRRLSETFGANILVNNEISREVLGKLVFGNDNNLKKLNNIIHPKIKELILKLQEEHENEDLVFLDIALLYEANFVDLVEKVAVVYVDEDVQLERLMTRNSLSKEEAELVSEVYDVFGQFSAWKLRNMTHEESPWKDNEDRAGEISFDEMKRYFKTRIE